MVLGVTGHRPDKLGGYGNRQASSALIDIAAKWLHDNKPELVITGMALGWDQTIAKACIERKIPFLAAVPFINQDSMWPQSARIYYEYLLGEAQKIVIVSPGGFSGKKMQIRNEWIVNNSQQILAMWDGTPGGTANCINYASSKAKPIINLYHLFKKYL